MTKSINEAPAEEVIDTETVQEEETQKQTADERIDAIENVLEAQSAQINDIAAEQEKIVDILEQISNKVATPSEAQGEEVVESSIDEEVVETNDIDEDETPETEADEAEETVETEEVETEETEEEAETEETSEESSEETTEETESEVEETEEKTVENDAEPTDTEATEEEETEEVKEETEKEDAEEKEPQEENKENKMTEEQINALKEAIKNEILDAQVKAPEVEETEEETTSEEPAVEKNWRKRYNQQIAAAWNAYRLHNVEAAKELATINAYNLEQKKALNANDDNYVMTIETADDFVLPPEIDKMIHGKRTNYSAFLNAIEYVQTDALTFAYATRVGDIDMQNVALCDDGNDGNLKPISTYELKKGVAQMEEMAAVTPVCDNATKYLAVDILSDVAAGYRNDYDRKLAQLAIIRFQQAVNATGNAVEVSEGTSTDKLVDFIKATTKVSDDIVNGTFVFTAKTKAMLVEYMFRNGANNELGHDMITTGEFPTIFGYPYIVVPNDLMPTIGEGGAKTFKATNNETGELETVSITSPVFYGDLDEFRGKTSGALKYDVSAEASYELPDGTVRSAWQRNELVLRGSFLRGGYIANSNAISGLAPKASS